jgi:pectin methylesterase-like acyl-CoA thioesterase
MERSVGLLVVEPVTLAANDDWVMGQANALLLEDISNQAIVREATLDNDTFYTFPHGVTNGLSLKPELATSYSSTWIEGLTGKQRRPS